MFSSYVIERKNQGGRGRACIVPPLWRISFPLQFPQVSRCSASQCRLFSSLVRLAATRAPDSLSTEVLAEVVDGGQTFRWNRLPDGVWQGVWAGCVARLKAAGAAGLLWSAPRNWPESRPTDYRPTSRQRCVSTVLSTICHAQRRTSRSLHEGVSRPPSASPAAGGDPPVAFLQHTKQIVQIKQMVELLARRHGREIVPGIHRLPTWTELATVSEEELRACLLGFRARYVSQTAQILAANGDWFIQLEQLPYREGQGTAARAARRG